LPRDIVNSFSKLSIREVLLIYPSLATWVGPEGNDNGAMELCKPEPKSPWGY
jgi:hypothetical protein